MLEETTPNGDELTYEPLPKHPEVEPAISIEEAIEGLKPEPPVPEKKSKRKPSPPQAPIIITNGEKTELYSAKGSKEEEQVTKDYSITPRMFRDGNYAKVRVKCGLTLSLGNYETARIDFEVEDFARRDSVEDAWTQLKNKANNHLKISSRKIREHTRKKNEQSHVYEW